MKFYKAGTLIIPSGPSHELSRPHLWIVCNDTDANGRNLTVSVATYTNAICDGTTILLKHEHPYLYKEKSYILYRNYEIRVAEKLERGKFYEPTKPLRKLIENSPSSNFYKISTV